MEQQNQNLPPVQVAPQSTTTQSPTAQSSLPLSKNNPVGIIIILLLLIIASFLVYYFDLIPKVVSIVNNNASEIQTPVANENLSEDLLYYSVQTRDSKADNNWTMSIDFFSYNPLTKTDSLVSQFSLGKYSPRTVIINKDTFYITYGEELNILYKLSKDELTPFIKLSNDRGITDVKNLKDGRFILASQDNGMYDRSSNHKIEIFSADGAAQLKSYTISTTSRIYSGLWINGIDESINTAYITYGGGDGGISWGTDYKLNLESGKVDVLGEYHYEGDLDVPKFEGYKLGNLNPSATQSVDISTVGNNKLEIVLRDMVTDSLTTKEIILDLNHASSVSSGKWIDDKRVVFYTVEGLYVLNIDTYETVKLNSFNPKLEKYYGIPLLIRGKYLIADYQYFQEPGNKYVDIYDMDTYKLVEQKPIINSLVGDTKVGGAYVFKMTSFLEGK